MKKPTASIGILFLALASSKAIHADAFSLNATVVASACNEGEIGMLNNGACNTQTTTILPQPLSSIVLNPLVSTIDVAQAEAYGTVTYGRVTGFASASASPINYVTSGTSEFLGQWTDTFTVTSATLPPGTPVDLMLYLELTGTLACSGPTGNAAQEVGNLEWGLNGIMSVSGSTCGTSVDEVQTSIYATSVGSVFSMVGFGEWNATANTDGVGTTGPAGSATADPPSANFFVDSLTPGATYTTASGNSYFSPSTTSPVPEPSFLIPVAAVFALLAARRSL